MKICLVSSSFHGGGITSYAHEIIKNYSREHKLCVIIGNDNYSKIDKELATVYYLESNILSYVNAKKLLSLINDTISPDVIINSNSQLLSAITPFINDGVRIITISHSLKYFEADLAIVNNRYIDKIIALSNYNKLYFVNKHGISQDKIEVVYNFISEIPNISKCLESKKKRAIPTIVFPGGYDPSKSPEITTLIVRKLLETDCQFLFYWIGNTFFRINRFLPFSFDVTKHLPHDCRLIFTGRLSRKESKALLANANIFLLPSRREGCSISLLEAMRGGTIPIVANFDNGNKEMVKDEVNGFIVDHNDIDAFVNRIIQVCKGSQMNQYLYDNSYNNWKINFSFKIWQEKMNDILMSAETTHDNRKHFSFLSFFISKIYLKYLYVKSILSILIFERVRLWIKTKTI